MTLAMLGMTWRAESWKIGCLEAERQLSQLPPQCRQLLPKTAFSGRASNSFGGVPGRFDRPGSFVADLVPDRQVGGRCHPGTSLATTQVLRPYSVDNHGDWGASLDLIK